MSRGPGATTVGAEYEDLAQEGMIAVWQCLAAGNRVSVTVLAGRMTNYIKFRGSHNTVDYATLLPLEDYRGVVAA